jgi:signal transduction histidine kinase
MVDDFIVAARLEDGGLAIERKQVELSGLVGSVAESFHRRGAEVRVSKEQATAECDPGRTRQILVNLLANAHQHGGSHITVEFDGDELTSSICVRDDGHGVAPDVEPRLFTRFVNDETTVLTAGTMGLGTWVARELARVMGGEVTYERVDGLTSFRVDLPRVHVEAPHAISKGSAQP